LASGAIEGLLAGLGFAMLLVGLNLAGDGAGLWPVVAGQVSSVLLLTIVMIGTVRRLGWLRMARRDAAGAVGVGITSAIAAISYFLSTQAGLLSIVAVLTALYPAATVLLARIVLSEAISRRQAAGLLLAGVAVGLIVLG
jgi:drug/metabolite transporter (DMT)-like permease